MMSLTGVHEFEDAVFGITQKKIFWTYFVTWRATPH